MPSQLIGNDTNFIIDDGDHVDLTRSYPDPPPSRCIRFETKTVPVLIDPDKSALVIIDMQNFFLSSALGRARGKGHEASANLETKAIPAARKAGIQVVWLNWGLTEQDIHDMPPTIKRSFGGPGKEAKTRATLADAGEKISPQTPAAQKGRMYKGLGADMGVVEVDGEQIDAGRLLMRDQWNAALHSPLDRLFEEGKQLARNPDVIMHKNRLSGMWGSSTLCQEFLERKGIKTLIFGGVNTDQCVSGTLTDSFSKGFDCVLLSDGCATTSPASAQEGIEYNAGRGWGYLTDCASLAKSVGI